MWLNENKYNYIIFNEDNNACFREVAQEFLPNCLNLFSADVSEETAVIFGRADRNARKSRLSSAFLIINALLQVAVVLRLPFCRKRQRVRPNRSNLMSRDPLPTTYSERTVSAIAFRLLCTSCKTIFSDCLFSVFYSLSPFSER